MKIAVLLFGHMRTFEKCYKSLQRHLLSKYDCDIFIHTWDKIDHNTATWHRYRMADQMKSGDRLKKSIYDLYKPKKVVMESQVVKDLGDITAENFKISKFGIKSMFHSMAQANDLRRQYEQETGTKYDYIVFVRPDVLLSTPFLLENFIDFNCKGHTLYTVGNLKSGRINDWKHVGASDVLFFTKPETVDLIFQDTSKLLKQVFSQKTSKYGPEYSFICFLEQLGINVFLINYLYGNCFKILRPKHHKHRLLKFLFKTTQS